MPELKKPIELKQRLKRPSTQLRTKIRRLRETIFRKTGRILSTAAILSILLAPKTLTTTYDNKVEQNRVLANFQKTSEEEKVLDFEKSNIFHNPSELETTSKKRESNFRKAIKSAGERLHEYLRNRSKKITKPIIFGPNLDSCYQWRTLPSGDGVGTSQKMVAAQKRIALEFGIPDIDNFSPKLRLLFNQLSFLSRIGENNNKLFILKHFPGGGSEIEYTESQEVYKNLNLKDAKETIIKPFELAIKSGTKGIMLSHVKYSFEKELLEKYPELKKFYLVNNIFPASLSPAIIKGLLRQELGFKGLVVGDWYNMSATFLYLREIKIPEFKDFGIDSKAIILATYAGVNWVPGLQYSDLSQLKTDLNKFFERKPEFKKIFENHIKECLLLSIKSLPNHLKDDFMLHISNLELEDLNSTFLFSQQKKQALNLFNTFYNDLNLLDKLMILTKKYDSEDVNNKRIDYLSRLYQDMSVDLWNRQGTIVFYFAAQLISNLTGMKIPEPQIHRETEWIRSLMKNKTFKTEYEKINWSDPQIILALEEFVATLKL